MSETSANEMSLASNETVSNNPLEETSITMQDVLEQEKELEEEYAAVLGGSDEKCCTYSKGYIKRQAVYSCLTCCPDAQSDLEKCAGICLACSYKCHENHELVELYTKRNFRCDCPTERIPGTKCSLNTTDATTKDATKHPINQDNLYNHNFQGLYCTCERPYPDPDNPSEDVMLQCAVCEDWYHMQHLNVSPDIQIADNYYEMICGGCMMNYEFLQNYTGLSLQQLNGEEDTSAVCDLSVCDDKLKSDLDKSISDIMNISSENIGEEAEEASITCNEESKENAEEIKVVNENNDEKQPVAEEIEEDNTDNMPKCKRPKLDVPSEDHPIENCRRPTTKTNWEKGATFWANDWRASLCKCSPCIRVYDSLKVSFLLDEEDSAKAYEERGINRAATETSTYEQGIRAFSSIGHTQQIDAIIEYNRMKDKLMEYLQTFVVSKKVVTEDDINRFFQEMRNEKNSNLGQPYFCR